ncbi:MAG: diguanylate cyclase [Vicinamibacterales bacterium]
MRRDSLCKSRRAPVLAFCLALVAFASAARLGAAGGDEPLLLVDRVGRVEAWPAVTVLFESGEPLTIEQVSGSFDRFEKPRSAYAALGVSTAAVWLRIPLAVAADSDGHWILDVDYAPLDLIDAYLLGKEGDVLERAALGNRRPFVSRPLQSRTHSVPLTMRAGEQYDLVVRIVSSGTLVLPVTLNKPTAFHAAALREQMLQGVLTGIALCLLLYSLAQWLVLREPFFLKYCVLITGSLFFSLLHFGIGTQYLWTDLFAVEHYAGGTSALIALIGSFLFIEQALDEPRRSNAFPRLMKGGAVGCALLAVVYPLDVVASTTITALISVLGPLPALLGIPGAVRKARAGDPIGGTLLVAWVVYFFTTTIIIGVIGGWMPAQFWTLHAFQFGATFDMVAFTYVLGLRTRAIRQVAQRASVERDLMRSLATTDPLTGLANRRGLSHAFVDAQERAASPGLLALYLIDVDGFKLVNDRFGHEAGDELLIQISSRLRSAVRVSDIVARLGGDEFVVVANGLTSESLADDLGHALVALGEQPFALARGTAHVGLTVGYALAPPADRDPAVLLQQADAAMYEGKRAGKRCLRRAAAGGLPPVSQMTAHLVEPGVP